MTMTFMLSLGAVLVGTIVPIVVLALVTRWRLSRASIHAASRRPRLPARHAPAPEEREPGLPWLRATIGPPPPAPTQWGPATRSCPRCGYRPAEAAFFCLRCGTRLKDRQRY